MASSSSSDAPLLDEDGQISDKLYAALSHIFSKYCTPSALPCTQTPQGLLHPCPPPKSARLTDAGLDAFARATNGAAFDAATKAEIEEFFVESEEEGFTMKGFEQMYTLQTANDEDETRRDLAAHGFDRALNLVNELPPSSSH